MEFQFKCPCCEKRLFDVSEKVVSIKCTKCTHVSHLTINTNTSDTNLEIVDVK